MDKEQMYKEALEKVLIELRSIDGPNEADEYINISIEIITQVLGEKT